MVKFIMMIKVCSALYGECMPEFQHKVVFDTWYDCAQNGLVETKSLMTGTAQQVTGLATVTTLAIWLLTIRFRN